LVQRRKPRDGDAESPPETREHDPDLDKLLDETRGQQVPDNIAVARRETLGPQFSDPGQTFSLVRLETAHSLRLCPGATPLHENDALDPLVIRHQHLTLPRGVARRKHGAPAQACRMLADPNP